MWSSLQNLWPFSAFMHNELKTSDEIVKKLPIPDSTKHFVYAIREPESRAVIYILSVQNLSERSALDAECLIREIKPDAVVVQIGRSDNNSDMLEKLLKDCKNSDVFKEESVPTSVFEVLKKCFTHKLNRDKYDDVASSLVLREIFGVSFNGHFIAAKKAADEVGSSFLMLESPFVKCTTSGEDEDVPDLGTGFQSLFNLLTSSSQTGSSNSISSNPRAFYHLADAVQPQMVKLVSSYMRRLNPSSNPVAEIIQPNAGYEVPQFAKCVYPLLVDLHDMFDKIPSMGTALACAQKMLSNVKDGEAIDNQILSEVYAFQIAIEALRIALNNAGRTIKIDLAQPKFCDLPVEDKSHAILAQALQSQARKYKSIVAVVDASSLAGLRRHWKTNVPPEVKDMVDQLITNFMDGEFFNNGGKKWLLADKPMVAVGAGATAILGASSLSKVVPASTFIKITTLHVPASLKLLLTQTQKVIVLAFGKGLGPSKFVVGPGMKGSVVKAAVKAEKIRAVAHSMIASVEKTSLSAMRTAFYEIMRKRRVQRIGVLPFVTFGCSVATCSGLLAYGDRIEFAAESFPAAPSIANLGRGIQSLHEASRIVRPAERSRIQIAIDSLLKKCKTSKI
ncbi:hypothetical protein CASFOL_035186 [Castilleja foliolosa]|uniref:Transmembrane protein n=1 Tax=Castilleja foliolosa TaxID=1961234 RepID=A0ABD3BT52_9LAMI